MLELLDATKNFRRVVITCRTQFFPEGEKDPFARLGKLEIGGFVCPMFYLSPFSQQQVEEYLEKRFPTRIFEKLLRKQNQDKVRALKIMDQMRSLRMRPFLLTNIEYLMENEEANWNDYSVYLALVEQWLNREETKIRQQTRKRGRSTASLPDRQKLWGVCEIVARRLYEKGVRSLTQSEFQSIVRSNPEIELIKELEHGSKSLLNKHSNGDFRFSHYSIQEFLIVHTWDLELDASRFTPQMWSFVVSANRDIPRSWLDKMPDSFGFQDMEKALDAFFARFPAPEQKPRNKTGTYRLKISRRHAELSTEGFDWKIEPAPDNMFLLFSKFVGDKSIKNISVNLQLFKDRVVSFELLDH